MKDVKLTDSEQFIIDKFKSEVCDNEQIVEELDNEDWHSLSIGFFLAHGSNLERACQLALYVRYNKHYFS